MNTTLCTQDRCGPAGFHAAAIFALWMLATRFIVCPQVILADDAPLAEDAGDRKGYLIQVALPISGSVDDQVKRMIDRLLTRLPKDGRRPVLVLEFSPKEGHSGEGSDMGRCHSLANYLTSQALTRVRTVAYVPESVRGHAVLVAIACEEIIMHEDAEFGPAGAGVETVEKSDRVIYEEVAKRHGVIPAPFVLGLLDKELEVSRVQTLDGTRYVLPDELRELEAAGQVSEVETVISRGELPSFSAQAMRLKHQFVSHLVNGRQQLTSVLRLPPDSLQGDPSLGEKWHAVRVDLNGPIDANTVDWVIGGLRNRLRNEKTDLVIVSVNSNGGSPADSYRLAHWLAELDPMEVRTVAFIAGKARADAAMVAWACDHVVMSESAQIGGSSTEFKLSDNDLDGLRSSIKTLAELKQRDWSMLAGLIDHRVTVHRYTHAGTGEVRYFCDEERNAQKEPDRWLEGIEIATSDGLSGTRAEETRVARYLADDFEQLKQLYHLDYDPPLIEPTWAQKWTQRLAEELAKPWIAGWLLFAAMFFLSVEFSHPGIGAPGFIAGVCFLLFFWSQYLNDTAGWLEILLFGAGVVCILLEIFVIPGFGIFGIGGILMVFVSVVLAMQNFVIPSTSMELKQVPVSLSMVLFAGGGIVAAIFVIRRFLPHAPLFRRMMLEPPSNEEADEIRDRESLVRWEYLIGKRGVTTTKLVPSGKARFGDDVVEVISDGNFIDKGEAIVVTEVRGNRVLVSSVEED